METRSRAWILFFVLGILFVPAAFIQMSGRPPDPPSLEGTTGLTSDQIAARIPGISDYIASLSRQMGNFMLTLGILMAAIAAVPFRRGEKWAWYALWVAPLMLLIQFLNSRFGSGWWADLGFAVGSAAGLLLSYRRFFPKQVRNDFRTSRR